MAVLKNLEDRRYASIGARTLVGRAAYCGLRLDDQRVAGEQALLAYDGAWWVRDLASRNGTFLDGERLLPGQRVELQEQHTLRFGSAQEVWEVVDLGPPGPAALRADGALRVGEHGMLALPDEESIDASVMCTARGWRIERGDEVEEVEDGAGVEAGGAGWTLLLPANLRGGSAQTVEVYRPPPISLQFVVSSDGDAVLSAFVALGGERRALAVRSHTHLLLALAEARLADLQSDKLPDEQGWLAAARACQRSGLEPHLLATYVHRARRQLAEAGMEDAQGLIEDRGRRDKRQLRLGPIAVSVADG